MDDAVGVAADLVDGTALSFMDEGPGGWKFADAGFRFQQGVDHAGGVVG